MDSTPKTAMVVGAAGGYLLGRTKKGKLALALGLMILARRLGITPQDLVKKGSEQISNVPEFAALGDQVRDELMNAVRTAVTSTVNRRIDGLSDSQRGREVGMARADGDEGDGEERDGEQRAGADEESASEDAEAEPERKQSPKPAAKRSSERNGSPVDDRKSEQRANGRVRSQPAKARR